MKHLAHFGASLARIGGAVARHWRAVLSRAALPMLALAASYGVYQYARLYVPDWVAFVQAAAFELTYLGLAVAQGVDARRARRISAGAVVTSIIYNTLAGLFHRVPLDAFALPLAGELAFAALHGLPLAWVAYLVADLMLHESASAAPAAPPWWERVIVRVFGGVEVTPAAPARHVVERPALQADAPTLQTAAPVERPALQGVSPTARIKELARQAGVSDSTMRRRVERGEVKL